MAKKIQAPLSSNTPTFSSSNLSSAIDILQESAKYLERDKDRKFLHDIELILYRSKNSHFRIVFLAPFNFGKSTLINAILGAEVLPSKAIRTTGIPIEIKYRKQEGIETEITLRSGELIKQNSSNILSEFAVLDRKGKPRSDVDSIEVFSCNRFLKRKIQLVDLPGTNDSHRQDKIIKDEVLKSDLIIQVLNANQAFTLDEQEKSKQWLLDRGIKASIFVVNKMNQIEDELDRKEILDDATLNIKSINLSLPNWAKFIYRVDALPALKATKEKHFLSLLKSGIIEFRVHLSTFIYFHKKIKIYHDLMRISSLLSSIKKVLDIKIASLNRDLNALIRERQTTIKKEKQRQDFFISEVENRIQQYRNWLSVEALTKVYETEFAEAIENHSDNTWRDNKFKFVVERYVDSIESIIKKASLEFGNGDPDRITISFPNRPNVVYPRKQDRNLWESVSDLFSDDKNNKRLQNKYERDTWKAYKSSSRQFLCDFSRSSLATLNEYERNCKAFLTFNVPSESSELVGMRKNISQLSSLIDEIVKVQSYAEQYEKRLESRNFFERIEMAIVLTMSWFSVIFKSL